jgi:hypothetical protein
MVNQDKSAIFFSKNCSGDSKEEVRNRLDIHREALAEKVFGIADFCWTNYKGGV